MQADEAERAVFDDTGRGGERVAVVQTEAELRGFGPGLDELMGVCLDTGRDPHEHTDGCGAAGGEHLEPVELVERVDDDPAYSGRQRGA